MLNIVVGFFAIVQVSTDFQKTSLTLKSNFVWPRKKVINLKVPLHCLKAQKNKMICDSLGWGWKLVNVLDHLLGSKINSFRQFFFQFFLVLSFVFTYEVVDELLLEFKCAEFINRTNSFVSQSVCFCKWLKLNSLIHLMRP